MWCAVLTKDIDRLEPGRTGRDDGGRAALGVMPEPGLGGVLAGVYPERVPHLVLRRGDGKAAILSPAPSAAWSAVG